MRLSTRATVIVLLLLTGVSGKSAAQSQAIETSSVFAFYSDPDVGLHHFLHSWARFGGVPNSRVTVTEIQEVDRLTPEERRVWLAAVESYKSIAQRSLLFDREMIQLRNSLADGSTGSTPEFVTKMKAVLASVRGIYRTYWWPLHDERNRQWVESVLPTLRAAEKTLASQIAEAYGATWVNRRIRVDLSPYADEVGAYTTAEPHVTISSLNPGLKMPFSLEMLFHEASHGDATEQPLRRLVDEAFAAAGKKAPPDLWHVVIFYTAGEVVRLSAGPKYQTYGENSGVYRRGRGWSRIRDLLEKHWRPVLEAKQNRSDAFRKLAEEF